MQDNDFETGGISVEKRIFIPIEKAFMDISDDYQCGLSVLKVDTCYVDAAGNSLLQCYGIHVAGDTWGKCYERRSDDNGRTWSRPTLLFDPVKTEEGVFRYGESCLFWVDVSATNAW